MVAKELGISSKELMDELHKLGVDVSSAAASVDEETEAKLKKTFAHGKGQTEAAKPAAKKPAAKKPAAEKAPAKKPAAKKPAAKKPAARKPAEAEEGQATKAEGAAPAKPAAAKPEAKTAPQKPAPHAAKTPVKEPAGSHPATREQAPAPAKAPVHPERKPSTHPGQKPAPAAPPQVPRHPAQPAPQKPHAARPAHPSAKGPARPAAAEPPQAEKEAKARKLRIPSGITVKEFAQKVGKTPADVIRMLMKLGEMITITQSMSDEALHIIGEELGYEIEVKSRFMDEEELEDGAEERPEDLQHRPPVVTIMGHVDHGKTSLLDAIRTTDVISTEFGGITQHIGAYQVKYNDKPITFVDTPGHESFTALRARGAQITDLVVLVVAADDGVMPQTVEAIDHAQAANVPMIVAVNKIDKDNADPQRVRQDLTEYHLVTEEWGGDTIFVDVSAKQKLNLDKLLESILLLTEIYELKANYDTEARGTIIEAHLDKGRGPIATVLVQKGTLRTGDAIVAGAFFGRVRAIFDAKGNKVDSATPSVPVEILGLSSVPNPGDEFRVVEDDRKARAIAQDRQLRERVVADQRVARHISLEELFERIKQGEVQELNLIVKCDVQGSIEALVDAISKLNQEEVRINVLHKGVGGITENDIMLASASNAIVIGFNVRPDAKARDLAEREKVDVRTYRVIYQVIEDLQAARIGMLKPEFEEVQTGYAEISAVFRIPRVGTVGGAMLKEGEITRNSLVRLVRDGTIIFEGKLSSLKRFKDDVRAVQSGFEFGFSLDGYQDIKEDDTIEVYEIREKPRTSI
jgi:translation initiation factor IF-2